MAWKWNNWKILLSTHPKDTKRISSRSISFIPNKNLYVSTFQSSNCGCLSSAEENGLITELEMNLIWKTLYENYIEEDPFIESLVQLQKQQLLENIAMWQVFEDDCPYGYSNTPRYEEEPSACWQKSL